jgi:hypothetical protein
MPHKLAQRLVNQLHCVDIGGSYRLSPMSRHLGGKPAGGGKIREGHASIRAKEVRTELISITGGFCN